MYSPCLTTVLKITETLSATWLALTVATPAYSCTVPDAVVASPSSLRADADMVGPHQVEERGTMPRPWIRHPFKTSGHWADLGSSCVMINGARSAHWDFVVVLQRSC